MYGVRYMRMVNTTRVLVLTSNLSIELYQLLLFTTLFIYYYVVQIPFFLFGAQHNVPKFE